MTMTNSKIKISTLYTFFGVIYIKTFSFLLRMWVGLKNMRHRNVEKRRRNSKYKQNDAIKILFDFLQR